jgi:hypothetical protein
MQGMAVFESGLPLGEPYGHKSTCLPMTATIIFDSCTQRAKKSPAIWHPDPGRNQKDSTKSGCNHRFHRLIRSESLQKNMAFGFQ